MLKSHEYRKKGLILNIGSFAGSVPSPMLATYSGTKAFLSTFSSALGEEVKKDNITVEHVNTYFVVRTLLIIHSEFKSNVTSFDLGIQAFQDSQIILDDSSARSIRSLRPQKGWACMRRCI